MGLFLEKKHELLDGTDLLSLEWDTESLSGYTDVLQNLVNCAVKERGELNVIGRITSQEGDDELHTLLKLKNRDVLLERDGYSALAKTYARLIEGEPEEYVRTLSAVVMQASEGLGLPIPPAISGIFGSWDERNL